MRSNSTLESWIKSFPAFASVFALLPNLESSYILSQAPIKPLSSLIYPSSTGKIRFGVFGQLRTSKFPEGLLDYFINSSYFHLTVAGPVLGASPFKDYHYKSSNLSIYAGFLDEDIMQSLSASVDFHLLLYDNSWDNNLESAGFYLAASHYKPIVSYTGGWIEKVSKLFRNVIFCTPDSLFTTLDSLANIHPDQYRNLSRYKLPSQYETYFNVKLFLSIISFPLKELG